VAPVCAAQLVGAPEAIARLQMLATAEAALTVQPAGVARFQIEPTCAVALTVTSP
jgi:hypothetical protein